VGCACGREVGKGLGQMLAGRGDCCCLALPGRGTDPDLVQVVEGVGPL